MADFWGGGGGGGGGGNFWGAAPAPAPAAADPFGGGGLFGAPAAAPMGGFGGGGDIFGGGGAAAFGAPAPAPAPDIFGGAGFGAAPAPAAGAWGAPAPAPAAYDPFGAAAGGGGGLFGPAPAPAPAAGGLFGAPAAGDIFGAPAPAPAAGGGGIFGAPAPFAASNVPRDANQDKWPLCADMRGTIYGCAWFDNSNLLLGDAVGDFKCMRVQRGQPFTATVNINVKAPIVSVAAHSQIPAGVFTADPRGNVTQWDLRSKKSNPRGALGQSMAFDRQSGVLAVGSWAKHVAVVDVRNNGKPSKIVTPGKCHCVDINGNIIYAGVNRDAQNMAVLLYDKRNTSQPVKTHKLDPREGLVRCIMRRGTQGGYVYGTRNGFIGLNMGGQNRTVVTDLAATFRVQHLARSPSLMVSSIAFNPTDNKTYIAVSNGRILKEANGKLGAIRFASSTSLSRIAFSAHHMAVCRSYNYFDAGASKSAGTAYPYNEVFVRELQRKKK